MGRGKVGLRRTINILPLLSSSELNLATQCDALLRSLLVLSSSCFSCPPFISKPTSFSCSSFPGLVVDILDWLTAGSIITFPPLTKNKEVAVMTLENTLSVMLPTVLG